MKYILKNGGNVSEDYRGRRRKFERKAERKKKIGPKHEITE